MYIDKLIAAGLITSTVCAQKPQNISKPKVQQPLESRYLFGHAKYTIHYKSFTWVYYIDL
jgi:hypothetical protein